MLDFVKGNRTRIEILARIEDDDKKENEMKSKTIKKRILNVVLGSIGKTGLIIDLMPSWIKNNPKGKIIVFDPRYMIIRAFPKNIGFTFRHTSDFAWVDHILKDREKVLGKNGALLVINGADLMFPKRSRRSRPIMHRKFEELLTMRLHLDLDIIIVFQGTDSMPNRIGDFATHYSILPILDYRGTDDGISHHEVVHDAIMAVNAYYDLHGKNPLEEFAVLDVHSSTCYPQPSIDKDKFMEIVESLEEEKIKSEIQS